MVTGRQTDRQTDTRTKYCNVLHVCSSNYSTDQRTGRALQADMVCRRCCSSGEDNGLPGLVGQANYPRPAIRVVSNHSKTWFLTKEGLHATAASIFASTGVKVTPHGRPYLGAAIGSPNYISSHVKQRLERGRPTYVASPR